MIAQRLAATAPQRTASLVSIMSSSGARSLPGPRREVATMLMRRPLGRSEPELVAHSIRLLRLIQSPAYPQTDEALAERLTFSMRRSYHPAGLMRQMLAIGADAERPQVLPRIQSPTLVLHGDADALVPIACGEDTARRIPGSRFIAVPGMGHDLPPEVCTILADHIAPFAHAANAANARRASQGQSPMSHDIPLDPQNPNSPNQPEHPRAIATRPRLGLRRPLRPHAAVPHRARHAARGHGHQARRLALLRRRPVDRVRGQLAQRARQAAGGHRALHHSVRDAQHHREQELQALPQQLQQQRLRQHRRGARAPAHRPGRSRVARQRPHGRHRRDAAGARAVRPRAGARARRPRPRPPGHRVHPLPARARAAEERHHAGARERNPHQPAAQEQLPGHRPARLGQRADPLQRPAHRPGRAARVHRELSQPQRVPRALCRAHVHGHLDNAASRSSSRCTRAIRAAAGWTSTRSARAGRRRCPATSARRGSRPGRPGLSEGAPCPPT
jgi:hypothetical protein